ncbi:MAG: GNAT family N-acetyltransferase [Rhodospirillales bacterium]|nr:GNAT family N-acetyltransferase [Rhodospirillales bacterium]
MPSGFDRGFIPVIHAGRDDRPDELDTVCAAETVAEALGRLGFNSEVCRVGLDLSVLRQVAARQPVCIFNLVDAIEGDDSLIGLAPAVLEHLGVPFTGCGAEAFSGTVSKLRTKQKLELLGIPTAPWSEDGRACNPAKRYIVKSDRQHGSLGMDGGSVVSGAEAANEITSRSVRFSGRFFAEEFIDGREFNVALIGERDRFRVLPIQEIDFTGFPEDRARIVDYGAKWDEGDIGFRTTNRKFGLELNEPALGEKLVSLSEQVWEAFSLTGYARVDFRIADGHPYILEVNANPAIAPDAGFAAAAAQAGINYDDLIERIVAIAKSTDNQPLAGAARTTVQVVRSAPATTGDVEWRCDVRASDVDAVSDLVRATGFFHEDETAIAAELVQERLNKGAASGYEFLIAEVGGRIAGYACFGKIDGTADAFDLYWIAVDPALQGRGLGRKILRYAETVMRDMGASKVYIDTSSSDTYRSTRAFYNAMGYTEAARLADFYKEGDGKVIFVSTLLPAPLCV